MKSRGSRGGGETEVVVEERRAAAALDAVEQTVALGGDRSESS